MKNKEIFKFLRQLLGSRRKLVSYLLATLGVATRNFWINLLNGLLFSAVIAAAENFSVEKLMKNIGLFLALLVGCILLDAIFVFWQSKILLDIENNARFSLHHKIYHAPILELEKIGQKGELLTRMNSDITLVKNLFGNALLSPLIYLISGVGGGIVLVKINGFLLIWGLILGGLLLIFDKKMGKKGHQIAQQKQYNQSQILREFLEIFSQNMTIRLGGLNQMMKTRFAALMIKRRTIYQEEGKNEATLSLFHTLEGFITYTGTIILCIVFYRQGALKLSEILLATQMVGMIVAVFRSFGGAVVSFQRALASVSRLREIFNLSDEGDQVAKSELESLHQSAKAVTYHQLSMFFSTSQEILGGISGVVEKNHLTLIKGVSGRGKSTFLKILLGLYPYKGSVKIFEKELANYPREELRQLLAYVPQEPVIFDGTLLENLYLEDKDPEANKNKAFTLLEKFALKDWFLSLEKGFETPLTSYETQLSGGQKQCLALTRAFLKDKPIILLDEALSAMDYETREKIFSSLEELAQSHTIILVSHIFSTKKDFFSLEF